MNALRTFLTRLGLASPLLDSGFCVCGHDGAAHEHYRPGTDCGACGIDICPAGDPVELEAVWRDQQVIEAVKAGDRDYTRVIADDGFVTLVERLLAAGGRR